MSNKKQAAQFRKYSRTLQGLAKVLANRMLAMELRPPKKRLYDGYVLLLTCLGLADLCDELAKELA